MSLLSRMPILTPLTVFCRSASGRRLSTVSFKTTAKMDGSDTSSAGGRWRKAVGCAQAFFLQRVTLAAVQPAETVVGWVGAKVLHTYVPHPRRTNAPIERMRGLRADAHCANTQKWRHDTARTKVPAQKELTIAGLLASMCVRTCTTNLLSKVNSLSNANVSFQTKPT